MTDEMNDLDALWRSIPLKESGRDDVVTAAAFSRFRKGVKGEKHGFGWWAVRIAAALFVPCAVWGAYSAVKMNDSPELMADIRWIQEEVPSGEMKDITLPDGTSVCMASGSRIVYPSAFSFAKRQIFFSGEGYFEVHSDTAHPFIIGTDAAEVEVTGTKFNLRSFPDDTSLDLALYEGKVRLSYTNAIGGDSEYVLNPGEHIAYAKTDRVLSSDFFNGREYCNWMSGDYLFKDEPLSGIARQLERIYGVDIIIRDAALAQIPYYLAISGGQSIDDVVSLLRMDGRLRARHNGDIIEIY